jgi:hypothetical protein
MREDIRVGLDSLTPPPGGLVRLRRRIAEERARRARGRRTRAVAAAVVTVVIGAFGWARWRGVPDPSVASLNFDRARFGVGQLQAPIEPLTLPESARASTAIRRVDLPTEEVVFYLVGFIQD